MQLVEIISVRTFLLSSTLTFIKYTVGENKELFIHSCGLGSRISDMEAEWRLKVITDLISY